MTTIAQDLGGVVLLPCPGCGGTATRVIGGPGTRGGPQYWAGCDHCRWRTWGDTEADAIAAWNTRTYSAEIAGALRDAERWREVANKAWFVDAAANVYNLHQRANSWEPSLADEDDVAAAIDSAMQQGGGGEEAAA